MSNNKNVLLQGATIDLAENFTCSKHPKNHKFLPTDDFELVFFLFINMLKLSYYEVN